MYKNAIWQHWHPLTMQPDQGQHRQDAKSLTDRNSNLYPVPTTGVDVTELAFAHITSHLMGSQEKPQDCPSILVMLVMVFSGFEMTVGVRQ